MAQIKDKPRILDYLKAGILYEVASIISGFILVAIGLSAIAVTNINLNVFSTLGILVIFLPVMWIVRGLIMYWVVKIVYKR
jgi:hypothetical protein